jgi:hypothetical protein
MLPVSKFNYVPNEIKSKINVFFFFLPRFRRLPFAKIKVINQEYFGLRGGK